MNGDSRAQGPAAETIAPQRRPGHSTAGTLDFGDLSPAALDSLGIDALEAITSALERLRAHRRVDPEGRAIVLSAVDRALSERRLSPDSAAEIRRELDEVVPAVVLAQRWRELIDPELANRPTIGAYRRGEA